MARNASVDKISTDLKVGDEMSGGTLGFVGKETEAFRRIGFQDLSHFTSIILRPPSLFAVASTRGVAGDILSADVFGHKYQLRENEEMDRTVVEKLFSDVVLSGYADDFVSSRVPFKVSGVVKQVNDDLLMCVKKFVHVKSLPIYTSDSQVDWMHVAVNDVGQLGGADDLLHPAYLYIGLVRCTQITCGQYNLAVKCAVDSGLVVVGCNMDTDHFVSKYRVALSEFLGLHFREEDSDSWMSVVYDSITYPGVTPQKRSVLAIAGDYLLKAAVGLHHVNVGSTPGEVSYVLTNCHSNARMSSAFGASMLAKYVRCGSNVSVTGGKVGATFLEATAALVFGQHGMYGVTLFAKKLGLLERGDPKL